MGATLPIAVHVILEKDGKILLMQRANTGFRDGEWSLPAGRLEEGESMRQGAAREALEEVNVSIDSSTLGEPLVMHHHDERGERIYLFFKSDSWTGEPKNMEPDKCSAVDWFSLDKLPEPIVPHIKTALDQIRGGAHYSEYGF